MDPFIDFGREVYLPWRILNGEHLGRDFVHPYGPFSVYFNAGLFRTFGVSILTLVAANLLIFAGILVALFALVRRAFGFLPAAIATLVGLAVFGFPHYWGVNNYTYAAPYAHEATHGMFFLLLLLLWLGRGWLPRGAGDGYITGLLIGLCCLTKTEYVVVALGVGALGAVRLWRAGPGGRAACAWSLAGLGGIATVVGAAWLALWWVLPPMTALRVAGNAIAAPFTFRAYATSAHVLHFLGADRPLENLLAVARWGAVALVAVGGMTALGRWMAKWSPPASAVFGVTAITGAVATVANVEWVFCGTAFPALLGLGAVMIARRMNRCRVEQHRWGGRTWSQMVFLVAGGGMLARMAFDPTISHYGFFQALLAAAWLCGFFVSEWPRAVPGGGVRNGLRAALVVVVLGGSGALVRRSLQFYALKQTTMGQGPDRVRGYDPAVFPLPAMWERTRQYLQATMSPDATLLVLPEGLLMNYWLRMKQPLSIADALPATLPLAPENVTDSLRRRPPEVVVVASRHMEELGFTAYAEPRSPARPVVEWVVMNYSVEKRDGSDPLAPGSAGVWILRRKR